MFNVITKRSVSTMSGIKNTRVNLVGIAGKKRAGKDTIANHLVVTQNYKRLSFADPLKKGIQAMFGFTDEQLDEKKAVVDEYWGITPRKAMQVIGTDVARDQFPSLLFGSTEQKQSFWILVMEKKIKEISEKSGDDKVNIIISDVRFEDEKKYIFNRGGRVFVVRNKAIEEENLHDTHPSESLNGFDDCPVFDNDGSIHDILVKVDRYCINHRIYQTKFLGKSNPVYSVCNVVPVIGFICTAIPLLGAVLFLSTLI